MLIKLLSKQCQNFPTDMHNSQVYFVSVSYIDISYFRKKVFGQDKTYRVKCRLSKRNITSKMSLVKTRRMEKMQLGHAKHYKTNNAIYSSKSWRVNTFFCLIAFD